MRRARWHAIMALLMTVLLVFLAGCSSTAGSGGEAKNGATGGTAKEAGKKLVIKVSHSSAPGSERDQGAKKLKEVIEKELNAEVQIYPASQLGDPRAQIEQVQAGQLEIAIQPTAWLGGFQPLMSVMDMPFFFPNDKQQLRQVLASEAARKVLSTTEEVGIKALDFWDAGYRQFTGNKPLVRPEDFQGLKARSMPSPVLFKQWESLGSNPINMPFSETYSALQTGAIVAQENPISTNHDMKFHEVQKYLMISNHGVMPLVIMVSKKWWDGLAPDVQAAVQAAAKAAGEETARVLDASEAEQVQNMDKNLDIVQLTNAQWQALATATQPARELYVEKFGDRGKTLVSDLESAIQKAAGK